MSDWSSDVCASDLDLSGHFLGLDVGPISRRSLGEPRRRRGAPLMLDFVAENLPRFLDGALITIGYAAISCAAGFVAAIPLALMRLSSNPVTSWLSTIYVLFFRGTPLLAQIFLIYYGSGQFWRSEEHTSELQSLMRIP